MLVNRKKPNYIKRTDYIRYYPAFLVYKDTSRILYIQNDAADEIVYCAINNYGRFTSVKFLTDTTFGQVFGKDYSIVSVNKNTIEFEKVSFSANV